MVTVEADVRAVEERLRAGALCCPCCAGRLVGWGRARARSVRAEHGVLRLTPRRTRCTSCGVTHVLLPVTVLLRRADVVEVIGAAIEAKAGGAGFRRIAGSLGRPAETVRGWLRRFAERCEAVRAVFTGWARAVPADPVLPGPAGSAWADAIAAIVAAAAAVATRFAVGTVAPWQGACAISGGCLLALGWPALEANTSSP
jgi:transposase-like protein